MADLQPSDRLPVPTDWISEETRRLLALSLGIIPKEMTIEITAPAPAALAMSKANMNDMVLFVRNQAVEIIISDSLTTVTVKYLRTAKGNL